MNKIVRADATEFLLELPRHSVAAIITDPPYPEIARHYGRMNETDWLDYMQGFIKACQHALKPNGSAMLVLQPNSERVGKMRGWFWRFVVNCLDEWNMVEDVYWWNLNAAPTVHVNRDVGLLRPSLKHCVWLGSPDCFRDQSQVMWTSVYAERTSKAQKRAIRYAPSGHHNSDYRMEQTAAERDGAATPYNVLPIANNYKPSSGGAYGHGASTPDELVEWWIRYITVAGDVVCDPFMGSGTTALVARRLGRHYTGCDRDDQCVKIARDRLAQPHMVGMF